MTKRCRLLSIFYKAPKITLLLSFVFLVAGFAPHVFATGGEFTQLSTIPGLTDIQPSDGFADFFNNLYKYLVGIAAILAVIMIIWGGLEYSTQDSISKKSDGKERIYQAIFGLVLVLSPVLVFSIINPDILNLSLNLPAIGTTPVTNTPPGGGGGDAPGGEVPGGGEGGVSTGPTIFVSLPTSCGVYRGPGTGSDNIIDSNIWPRGYLNWWPSPGGEGTVVAPLHLISRDEAIAFKIIMPTSDGRSASRIWTGYTERPLYMNLSKNPCEFTKSIEDANCAVASMSSYGDVTLYFSTVTLGDERFKNICKPVGGEIYYINVKNFFGRENGLDSFSSWAGGYENPFYLSW